TILHALPAPIADGYHTITVEVKDHAGWASTDTISILLDTLAPVIGLNLPAQSSTNDPTLDVTYVLTEEGSGMDTVVYQISVDGVVWNTLPTTSPTTNVLLSEGNNMIRAIATDNASNQAQSDVYNVTLDTFSPTLIAYSITPQPTPVGPAIITLEFSEAMIPAITISHLDADDNSVPVAGIWTSPTHWEGVLDADLTLGDGTFNITVEGGADMTGNVLIPVNLFWTVDTTPPEITSIISSAGNELGAEATTITVTFDEPMQDIPLAVNIVGSLQTAAVDGTWISVFRWQGTFTVTTSLGDGNVDLEVGGGKDTTGNTHVLATYVDLFNIDTTSPVLVSAWLFTINTIELEFSEEIETGSVATTLFTLSHGTVNNATLVGKNITLEVSGVSLDAALNISIAEGLEDMRDNTMPLTTSPVD
ncbi:MAG: hypothetical protein KAT70_07520, partial [Thermoplasmata archaeon]|nr:hypothetical protein [Thermoplasmata archaeon]